MEIYGPDLGMPHTRAMGDGLFELRLKAGEKIVMLHQFTKKTDKTPFKEIEKAKRRMKEVNNAHTQRT